MASMAAGHLQTEATRRCHLEPSRVCPVGDLEVEISQQQVGGDSSACLPADTCDTAFERKTSPAQRPCLCTSCAVMAKYVKVVATPTVARGKEEKQL